LSNDASLSSDRHHDLSAGFSLIEVLVSLMIVAVMMAIIAPFSHDTLMRVIGMSERLPLARGLSTMMTSRAELRMAEAAFVKGSTGDIRWTVGSRPAMIAPTSGSIETMWTPVVETLSVKAPSGVALDVELIRLKRP